MLGVANRDSGSQHRALVRGEQLGDESRAESKDPGRRLLEDAVTPPFRRLTPSAHSGQLRSASTAERDFELNLEEFWST